MWDNFLVHDFIPSKTKVEFLSVWKKFNIEISAIKVGLQRGLKVKLGIFNLKPFFNALNMLSALPLT